MAVVAIVVSLVAELEVETYVKPLAVGLDDVNVQPVVVK